MKKRLPCLPEPSLLPVLPVSLPFRLCSEAPRVGRETHKCSQRRSLSQSLQLWQRGHLHLWISLIFPAAAADFSIRKSSLYTNGASESRSNVLWLIAGFFFFFFSGQEMSSFSRRLEKCPSKELSCVVLWNIHGDLCLRFSYGCYLTQVTMSTDEPGFQLIQILPFLGWLTCLLRGYYFFSDHTQAQCFTASQYWSYINVLQFPNLGKFILK